ncbi:MAG: UDP-N-acetylmuramoyl-L-alanine--D-glutamate ligase, partial [Bdellovibrionales bacterium]|nr:UDP-N-acetylmuramoyl-L-alanine--D-glutamate ligase [Bdellovibrionales bacterium]
MTVEDIKGKKIMVVGLSKTGVSMTKFLVEHGGEVTISDHKSAAELADSLEQIESLNIHYDL